MRVDPGSVVARRGAAAGSIALVSGGSPVGRALPDRTAWSPASHRVVIVSNRLPWTADRSESGVRLVRSAGGLATGLAGVHARSSGLWIGWSGARDPRALDEAASAELASAGAVPVHLDEAEVAGYYRRFSNELLWPALHGFAPRGDARDWETYRLVNERFARAAAERLRPGDVVWVHDYHLMLVPALLRRLRPDARIGFFLHTPFPSAEHFRTVPRHEELLRGLLGADLLGFHTREYLASYRDAVTRTMRVPAGEDRVLLRDRDVGLMTAPMGIDVAGFGAAASRADVRARAAGIRAAGTGPLFVGVDRLDYTKGIPHRLLAFERLLERRPDLRAGARLVQVAVPSREDAAGYGEVRAETERLVERINRRFGDGARRPVEYERTSLDRDALVALYRAADVMLVTPLRDGMNLVAKEFVAARTDEDGVLVLSEHAGAAAELRAAVRVDPYDIDSLAGAYESALEMTPAERRVRMRRLRQAVRGGDVFAWADRVLDALHPA